MPRWSVEGMRAIGSKRPSTGEVRPFFGADTLSSASRCLHTDSPAQYIPSVRWIRDEIHSQMSTATVYEIFRLGLFHHLPHRLQKPLTGKDVEILTNPPPPHDALLINEEERPLGDPPYIMGVLVLPFGRAIQHA